MSLNSKYITKKENVYVKRRAWKCNAGKFRGRKTLIVFHTHYTKRNLMFPLGVISTMTDKKMYFDSDGA